MAFRVELSNRAQADITAIYDWLRSQPAGDAGERWFAALREAISSLSSLPLRCPVAPESRESLRWTSARSCTAGSHVYRILFAVEGDVVRVLHLRHGRRRPAIQAVKNA